MCFSAQASFTAAAILSVVGAATISRARRANPSLLPFALFPAIFAIHQLIEGFVWLNVNNDADGAVFRYLYIFIAFLLWPVLTPLAAAVAEKDPRQKRLRHFLLAAGVALATYLAIEIARASNIEARVFGHSLGYRIGDDWKPSPFLDFAYAAITLASLVTLGNRFLTALGILVGLSFFYAYTEMKEVWQSVWCFSAAVFSALIYMAVAPEKEKHGVQAREAAPR